MSELHRNNLLGTRGVAPDERDLATEWQLERDRQARASQERRAAELEALRQAPDAVRWNEAMPAGHPVSWGAISRGPWPGEKRR